MRASTPMMDRHRLVFQKSLPADAPDAKVYSVLEQARELLRRMAKDAPDIKFKHKVEDTEAKMGGPLGQTVQVVHITLIAEFTQVACLLPAETQGLKRQYDHNLLARDVVSEMLAKAKEERLAMEKQVREAAKNQPDPVRDFPELVDTVPAHQVALDKMVLTDAEIARASQHPLGVEVSVPSPTKE